MNSNGNTTDRQGRLVNCEHGGRRAWSGPSSTGPSRWSPTATTARGSIRDVVVASNGTIWFTDPTYGIGGFYEGLQSEPEQEKHNVYRVEPQTGSVTVVVDDFLL
jgi:gluconolactonase